MAVFPDRIVLKNSTDDQATIEAAIQAGGADEITQGEIVLGIENTNVRFYTKAGDGSIVSLGSAAGAISALGDLTDVDLSTPATDGQVIAYNSTSGNWEPANQSGGGGYTDPLTTDGDIVIRSGGTTTRLGIGSEGQVLTVSSGLPTWSAATGGGLSNVVEDTTPQLGGNLDTNTYYIVSTSGDVSLAPSNGELVVRGGSADGKLTLNCTMNTHGVSIQSPPHAQAATYTLVLPSSAGTAGQVLTSQGGAQLTWEDAATGGGGGGAVDSVNGQTGVVSLGVEDLDDFALVVTPATNNFVLSGPGDILPGASGEWGIGSALNNYFTWFDSDPIHAWLDAAPIGTTVEFVTEGGYVHTAVTSSLSAVNQSGFSHYISFAGYAWPTELTDAFTADESITVRDSAGSTNPLVDGDILQWNSSESKWQPAQLPSGGGGATAINDLTDVDTSGTLGTLTYTVDDAQTIGQASTGTQNAGTAGGSVYWDFSPTDANSVDRSAFWDARVADAANGIFPVMRYTDGGQAYDFTPTSILLSSNIYRVFAPAANSPVLPPNTRDSTVTFIAAPQDGQVLVYSSGSSNWQPGDVISKATLQAEVAAATDFADFQARIAAL